MRVVPLAVWRRYPTHSFIIQEAAEIWSKAETALLSVTDHEISFHEDRPDKNGTVSERKVVGMERGRRLG